MKLDGSQSTGIDAQGNFHGIGCRNDRSPDPEQGAADDLRELSRLMLARLSRTIEGEIIPRLMLALESIPDYDTGAAPAAGPDLAANVDEFVRLVLAHEVGVLSRYVHALRGNGVPLPAIYLDLLAPAARQLGLMWERDECSFSDVTIGVCRLHQVLLEFGRCFDADADEGDSSRRALVVPVPGEQHTFGLFIVNEFLRRAGWNCWNGSPGSEGELLALVERHAFDMIGLSISADRHLDPAKRLIPRLRERSRNAAVTILAGGRMFVDNPALAIELGADGTAADGKKVALAVQNLKRKMNGNSAG